MRPNAKFLGGEGKRNRHNAGLFCQMLFQAWGDCDVIVGHHINFLFDKNLETEDEIPAADTLLFDHAIMGCLFGDKMPDVLAHIAVLGPYARERYVAQRFNELYPERAVTIPEHPDHI